MLYQQTAKKRIFSRKTTAGMRVPGGERSRCPRPLCWRDWSRQGGWCGPAGCPPARLKQRAHLPRTLHPAAPRAEPPRRPPGGGTSRQRPEASGASRAGTLESPGAGGHGPGSAGAGARTRRGAPGTSPALPAAPRQRATQGPGVTGQAGLSWCPWRAPPRLLGPRAPCPVEAWNPPRLARTQAQC